MQAKSFERNPPPAVIIKIVQEINDEVRQRAMQATGYDGRGASWRSQEKDLFDRVCQTSSLVYSSCGCDNYSVVLFLDYPLWDTEDADTREVDEEASGFQYKTDLKTHLLNQMRGMTRVMAAAIP